MGATGTDKKNSYHGQAVGTGLVENQIQINAAFSKVFKWMSGYGVPENNVQQLLHT